MIGGEIDSGRPMKEAKRLPLSVVLITRDSELHLAEVLRSVEWAEDIVVLDNDSQDQTLKIAESFNARVFSEEWRGFGRQKRRATELAKYDWVLNLDSDEVLSPEAKKEVLELLTVNPSTQPERFERHDAYSFPRLSFHMGRWIRHGGWYPDRQVRLYDRTRANWSEAELHEKVQANHVGPLNAPLFHYVFRDLTDQVSRNNKYSSLGANELSEKGQRFSLVQLIIKPWVKFFELYLWKRGFLDGLPGFIIAVGAGYSVFLKWAKLYERQHIKPRLEQK
jgi:glycosyltransferase involved in cell wall biosynthesis